MLINKIYNVKRVSRKNKYYVKIHNLETKKTNYFKYSNLTKIKNYILILESNQKYKKRTSIKQIIKKTKKHRLVTKDIRAYLNKIILPKTKKKTKRKIKPYTKIQIINKLNKNKKRQFATEFVYKPKQNIIDPFKQTIQKITNSKKIIEQLTENPSAIKDNFNMHISIFGYGKHRNKKCELAQIFIPQADLKRFNREVNLEEITEIESQDEFLAYLKQEYNANIRKIDTGIVSSIKVMYDVRLGLGKQTKLRNYDKRDGRK